MAILCLVWAMPATGFSEPNKIEIVGDTLGLTECPFYISARIVIIDVPKTHT